MKKSIAGLERRIRRLVAEVAPASRTIVLVLEEGESIPEEVTARIGERDSVIIQLIPGGYFGDLPRPEQVKEEREADA